MLYIQSGEKNLGRSFNYGKRTCVVCSIRGKELGLLVQSGNLRLSFNQGKRNWVVR